MATIAKQFKMKDHFGRELKAGDLVVSKATGRHSSMSHGIMLDSGSVYFLYGSIGGASDKCLVSTEHDEKLESVRLAIIATREQELVAREEKKKSDAITKIKKKDLIVGGVYANTGNDTEMYIGDCIFNGERKKDLWVTIRKKKYNDSFELPNLELSLVSVKYSYGFSSGGREYQAYPGYRFPKHPKKLKKTLQLTEDEVSALFRAEFSTERNMPKEVRNYILPSFMTEEF